MDNKMNQVIDVLQSGWGKKSYYNEDTQSYCVLGAIASAYGGLTRYPMASAAYWTMSSETVQVVHDSKEFLAIAKVIQNNYPERVNLDDFDVAVFNDHRDTNIDDVILVCEKARAQLEEMV